MKQAVDKIEEAKNNWESSINALPDGNTKTSMQGSFEGEASGISHEQYQKLLDIATKAEAFYKSYQEYLDQYFIQDKEGQYKRIVDTDKGGIDWIALYSMGEQQYSKDPKTVSLDCIDTAEQTPPVNPFTSNRLTGPDGVIDNDDFYKYLSEICGEKANAPEEDKKTAKKSKESLIDKGNESGGKTADAGRLAADVDWSCVDNATQSVGDSKTVETDIKNEDKKKISQSTKDAIKSSTNFLDGIGSILTDARDKIYLAEYATGMFSCYTSGKKDGLDTEETLYTLAGKDPAYHMLTEENNVLFRSEQEYILWGNRDQQKNVDQTLGAIFGIRLALNMVYAFTGDAEINATTLAWATAIAGWTGFGVPLVQSVLKIAFALAESVYDVTLLKEGYDVAFYKTTSTWVMKPSGITGGVIKVVEGEVKEKAKDVISDAFACVNNLANSTIDNVNSSVAATVENTKNAMIDSAVSTILSPFEKKIIALSTQINSTAESVTDEVNRMYDNVMNGIDQSNTLGKLEYELMQNNRDIIVEFVTKQVNTLKGKAQKALDQASMNYIADQLKEKAKLSGYITQLGDELKQKVNESLSNMEAGVEEAVTNEISGFFDEIYGTVNTSENGVSSGTVTRGAAFTVNYQEYVHIFLILKCAANNEQYLIRIGHLIQLNMHKRNNAFALNQSYTLLQLNAKVKVNTTFLGKLDSFLENPTGGQSQYTLTYHGLSGY